MNPGFVCFDLVQRLDMHIPKKSVLKEPQGGTLLDGELVTDIVKCPDQDGRMIDVRIPRYLIYDAIAIDGLSTAASNLMDRLRKVYEGVIIPRREWEKQNPKAVENEKKGKQYLEIYLKVSRLRCIGTACFQPRI